VGVKDAANFLLLVEARSANSNNGSEAAFIVEVDFVWRMWLDLDVKIDVKANTDVVEIADLLY